MDRNRHTEELEKNKKLLEASQDKAPVLEPEDDQSQGNTASIRKEEETVVIKIEPIVVEKVSENDLLNRKLKARQELIIQEKIQLDSLLNKLNDVSDKSTDSIIKQQIEYFIPYYLTKEWVTRNLI